jgi:hypothetical protein
MSGIDISKIPQLAERQELARLQAAEEAADDAYTEASENIPEAASDALEAAQNKLQEECDAKIEALQVEFDTKHGLTAKREVRKAAREAREAYADAHDINLSRIWGPPRLCAVSGVPILSSDEVFEHEDNSDRAVLACLLPLREEADAEHEEAA